MGTVIELVSAALRGKLIAHGVCSLSEAEWHLLRVSHLVHAIDDCTLDRVLGDTPLAELNATADALQTIGAVQAAHRVRTAADKLAAENDPRRALPRPEVVTEIARKLGYALGGLRGDVETRLMDFAFQQRDLTAEFAAAG